MLHIEHKRKDERRVRLELCALRGLVSHYSDLECRLSNEIPSIWKVNKTSQAGGLMDKKFFSLKDYFLFSCFKKETLINFERSVSGCQRVNLFTHLCFMHSFSCYRWVPNSKFNTDLHLQYLFCIFFYT